MTRYGFICTNNFIFIYPLIVSIRFVVVPWSTTFRYEYLGFCSRSSINRHIAIKCTFCSIWYTRNITLISYNLYFISSSCWTSKGRSMVSSSFFLRSIYVNSLISRLNNSYSCCSYCSRVMSNISIRCYSTRFRSPSIITTISSICYGIFSPIWY